MHKFICELNVDKIAEHETLLNSFRILTCADDFLPIQLQLRNIIDDNWELFGNSEHIAIETDMLLSDKYASKVRDGSDVAAAVVLVDGFGVGQLE